MNPFGHHWYMWKYHRDLFWWNFTRHLTGITIAFTLVMFILWLVSLYWAYMLGLHSLAHHYNVTVLSPSH